MLAGKEEQAQGNADIEAVLASQYADGGKTRLQGEKDVAALNTRLASYEVHPENRNLMQHASHPRWIRAPTSHKFQLLRLWAGDNEDAEGWWCQV
jgi:hypothetical protein